MFLICPPRWGLSRAARAHSPGSRFLAGAPSGTLARLWTDLCRLELVASPGGKSGPENWDWIPQFRFQGVFRKHSPKCKGCGEARPLSLDLSSPVRPSVRGEGMCKRGSFTVHGGGDPQFLTSRLWPFKYVSGLGEEHLPGPQHLQEAPSPSPSID